MPRYAAFLRGVMPMNCKMPELQRAFEAAGFTEVKTILGSGNVAFNARVASETALERRAEAAMLEQLGHAFMTFVRPVDELQDLLESDPYRSFRLDAGAKRIVTFLRDKPPAKLKLPPARDGARILVVKGREAFSAYTRTPKGPVFMTLIAEAFGKDVTTRTWDTVGKVARA
jgi:uncharacterized protein (DUF1697 family)